MKFHKYYGLANIKIEERRLPTIQSIIFFLLTPMKLTFYFAFTRVSHYV